MNNYLSFRAFVVALVDSALDEVFSLVVLVLRVLVVLVFLVRVEFFLTEFVDRV